MKDYFLNWTLPILAGFCAAALLSILLCSLKEHVKGLRLKIGFARLKRYTGGAIAGIHYDVIRKYCGSPCTAAQVAYGIRLCRWQQGMVIISLLFDEQDICVDVDRLEL